MRVYFLTACLLLTSLLIVEEAFSSERVIIDRIRKLEKQLSTLERQVYRGKVTPPSALAETQPTSVKDTNHIKALEFEIYSISERLSTQEQLHQELRSEIQTLKNTLHSLESSASHPPSPANNDSTHHLQPTMPVELPDTPDNALKNNKIPASMQNKPSSKNTEAPPHNETITHLPQVEPLVDNTIEPAEVYDAAFVLLKEKQYDAAAESFRQFIDAFPSDPLIPNAYYWLGETDYTQGRYTQAATQFSEGYERSPDGIKAPDNLLKLGMSLARADQEERACTTFQKLQNDFSSLPSAVAIKLQKEIARIHCHE